MTTPNTPATLRISKDLLSEEFRSQAATPPALTPFDETSPIESVDKQDIAITNHLLSTHLNLYRHAKNIKQVCQITHSINTLLHSRRALIGKRHDTENKAKAAYLVSPLD